MDGSMARLAVRVFPRCVAVGLLLATAGLLPSAAAPAGSVLAWGDNYRGELGNDAPSSFRPTPGSVLVSGGGLLTGVIAVSAGDDHTLALKQDGTVWTWGCNLRGGLGDGTTAERNTPVQVVGPGGAGFLTGVTAVSGGNRHSLALRQDGTVWAWGDNELGELGDGTTTDRHTPVQVVGLGGAGFLTGVTAVAAASYCAGYSLAVKNDGTVWGWGYNGDGELGNGVPASVQATPVQVVGSGGVGFLTGVMALSARGYHVLALKTDGTVWAWGDNGLGELGDGTTVGRPTPVQVRSVSGFLTGVTAVSAGGNHSLALRQDGTVWAWGRGDVGELGAPNDGFASIPVQVLGPGRVGFLTGIISISAGSFDSLAVKQDGAVYSWGENWHGQLGDGTGYQQTIPVQVVGPGGAGFFTGATAIAAGSGYEGKSGSSSALRQDGTVWTWGDNYFGQSGDGTSGASPLPVNTLGLGGAGVLNGEIAVSAGDYHSLALKQDGTVWAWGSNYSPDLGDGTTTDRYTPVQVRGPGGIGFFTGVIALSAGFEHSLAVRQDGTAWEWGYTPAQVPEPYPAVFTGVRATAAGLPVELGLKSDGTVWAWLTNSDGQPGTPTQVVGPGGAGFLTGMVAVATGGNDGVPGPTGYSLALNQDGTVWAWGGNDFGQLGDGTTLASSAPAQVLGPDGTGFLTDVVAVSAGNDHSLALKQDGTVWSWGLNDRGQLGDGTTTGSLTPVQVLGPWGAGLLTGIIAVSAHGSHSLALRQDGTIWAWGNNDKGELGNGIIDGDAHPAPGIVLRSDGAGPLEGISAISAGGVHNLAIQVAFPVITGFTPASGHVGDSVTISGSAFTGASEVAFHGASSSFTVNSDSTITATVPVGAATGAISVTTPGGTAISSASFTVPAPSGITFNPTSGSLGSMVAITGSGFTGATSVKFNGADSSFSVNSDTNITDFVPYTATTGPISVTTPAGTGTSATNFTVNAPSITSFNPNNGSVNSTVNITGSAFTAASAVKFNGVSGNYVLNSDTSITATVPFGATTGPISVTSPAGTGTSATNFTVNPPSITNFSPTSGPIGSFVTLTGSSFTGATAVKFGSISANFFSSSDTQINATVPPGFVSGLISVVTPAGTGDTSALTPANFTVPGPVITNLNPNNGSLRSIIVITGTGFTSATGVQLNGVSANYYINLDTQIVAFVPDTATTGLVTVTTPSGTSPGVNFTVNPPVITGFNPTHDSIGSFVNISGSGFTLASGVKFRGVSASFFVSTDTSISAQVPTGFVSGTISVTGPIGTGTSAGTFTVDAPAITGFSPTHGAAGTNVTVNGSGFTGATSIQFNGVTASLFVANDGQINTTVPAGATTGPITVTGPGGTTTSATNFMVP